jgi:hypothetical protein
MYRTVALAVAMCGATLATQAMACETPQDARQEIGEAGWINDPAAISKFQGRIGSEAAVQDLTI